MYKFAVSPDGTRLAALGNFTSVGEQARQRAFMLQLGSASATLSPWYYQTLDNTRIGGHPGVLAPDVD